MKPTHVSRHSAVGVSLCSRYVLKHVNNTNTRVEKQTRLITTDYVASIADVNDRNEIVIDIDF